MAREVPGDLLEVAHERLFRCRSRLAPSAFEAAFVSAAHGEAEIATTLERLDDALAAARR
jgi:glutamate-1-semialdehyde aminotransferase